MERLFIDRVRINECLCDSLSPTCLALAGLVQRTKPSICRPCALTRLGTPLHLAAYKNSVDAAKVLIDRGALVDARNDLSLNPRTLGEKAQCTWQLGPGDAWHLCEEEDTCHVSTGPGDARAFV